MVVVSHRIFIGMGSNVDAHFYINQGIEELKALFGDIAISDVYESESVGFDGDNFLNLVVQAQTHLSVEAVVAQLKAIERRQGRPDNARKFSPRTLDLDLLLYDQEICLHPVQLPRAEIMTNAFVLLPLADMAPDLQHPVAKQTMATLWQQYSKQQQLWKVELNRTI